MTYINNLITSLTNTIGNQLPGILGALLVLIIGWFIARIIRRVVLAVFSRTKIDERIASKMNFEFRLDQFFSKLAYYLILVYVLVLVLGMMGIEGVLEPLQQMLSEFTGMIPNIIAAGLVGFIGYIVAKIASEAVGFLSETLEGVSARIGWASPMSLTKIVKQLVFLFVFIPILIIAIDRLNMKAFSEPATEMLAAVIGAIPSIITAALIIGVFFFVGKYVVAIVIELLENMGLDGLTKRIGIDTLLGNNSLSKVVGQLLFFFIMFSGLIAAFDKLEMNSVSTILNNIFFICGRIGFGLVILVIGNFISNLAANMLQGNNNWLASLVRFATLGIFLAIALHTMGIAQSIVNLAFGLTLGAVAVAFALAFGLGGREAAGQQVEIWLKKFRNEE